MLMSETAVAKITFLLAGKTKVGHTGKGRNDAADIDSQSGD
jgi:hypothetical protein